MDKKTILKQIKELIKFSGEQKFLDAKLIDGTTIVRVEADALEVGLPLFVVTEEGLIPAPTGEHTLEDGTVVTVDELGVITEIEAVEAPEETAAAEVVEELAEEAPVEEEVVVEEKPEEMKKKMEEMEARIAEIEKMMSEMLPTMKETAEFSNSVLDKINNFVKDTPAELEFKSIKSEYKKVVEDNKTNKFSGLEGIKNIRTKK